MSTEPTADDIPPDFAIAMHRFWREAGVLIASGCDYPAFMAKMRAMNADILLHNDGFIGWRGAWIIARTLWKCTPNPALIFACPTLPDPGRNDACPCGSGRKYKHCCLPHVQSAPAEGMNGLSMLLDAMPRKRWRELAGSRVPVAMVEATVEEWREQYQLRPVIALLDPWFKPDAAFVAKHERLLDDLLDACGELGHPRKKERLLDRAIAVGDGVIRSSAWQRRASMLADAHDFAAAWQAFTRAQRANPDAVSLSHLEVTILLNEGRTEEARARSQFWVKRLQALHNPDLDGLIALVGDLGERGTAAIADKLLEMDPELGALADLLRTAPPVASLYKLDPADDSAGPLQPGPRLRKALAAWQRCAPTIAHSPLQAMMGDDEDDPRDISDWLPVLRKHPVLWNSFEVLDVIAAAIPKMDGAIFEDVLTRPLLERSERLLHAVLQDNAAEGKRFEWGWLENRPALELLGQRIALGLGRPADAAQLARLEWLVLTLNPNDNQGFRSPLMHAYLEHGQFDAALALSDRYPDDFGNMRFDRVLALFAAGRKGDALTALARAHEEAPLFAAWLLKSNPTPPRPDHFGVRVGSDYEAWVYRDSARALWQRLGALDWLRGAIGAIRKRGAR